MKTPLVLVMVALAGSVNAQVADPATYAGGFPGQPPSGSPVADPAALSDTTQPPMAPASLPVPDAQSYRYFQQPLQPYGEWVVIAGYGPCWRPARVHAGWRPYLEGRWVGSNNAWCWDSSEPWGWATYHYGRWMLTAQFGWVWVPGHEWAPAWVNWRSGEDLVGWEPMPPDVVLDAGFYDGGFGLGVDCWTMVRGGDFLAPNCASVAFSREACRGWLPRTVAVASIGFGLHGVAGAGFGHHPGAVAIGRGVTSQHIRDASAPNRRSPNRVQHNSPAVGSPAVSPRSFAPDAGRAARASATSTVRFNTRPQATASASSRSFSWSAPAVSHTSSAAPARSFTPSPSSAPSRSSSWSTPAVSHHVDPPVHQTAVSSGNHSAPSAPPSHSAPSHNTGRPSSR